MTNSEDIVRKRYEQLGFIVVHCGAPDFLIFNYDRANHTMYNIHFAEVKNGKASLTLEQNIWRCALETLHCRYVVETPDTTYYEKEWFNRNFSDFECRHCNQKNFIHKDKILEKLREMNKIPTEGTNGATWDIDRMINDYKNKNNGKTIKS